MEKFKFAIFDFDGVIANSEDVRIATYKQLFIDEFKIKIEFDKKKLIGVSEENNLSYLLKKYNLVGDITNLKDKRNQIINNVTSNIKLNTIIYKIINTLFLLRIPIFIASSSSRKYIKTILNNNKSKPFYKEIFGSEDVTYKKPNPEIYLKIKNKYKMHTDDILVFEDSPSGIAAAKKINLHCVGVLGSFTIKDLLNADYYLNLEEDNKVNSIINLFK